MLTVTVYLNESELFYRRLFEWNIVRNYSAKYLRYLVVSHPSEYGLSRDPEEFNLHSEDNPYEPLYPEAILHMCLRDDQRSIIARRITVGEVRRRQRDLDADRERTDTIRRAEFRSVYEERLWGTRVIPRSWSRKSDEVEVISKPPPELNIFELTEILGQKELDQCSICIEDLIQTDDMESVHIQRLEKCRHLFHTSCLSKWTAQTCPLCRTEF